SGYWGGQRRDCRAARQEESRGSGRAAGRQPGGRRSERQDRGVQKGDDRLPRGQGLHGQVIRPYRILSCSTTRMTSAVRTPVPVSGVAPELVPVATTRIQSESFVNRLWIAGLKSPEIVTGTVLFPLTLVAGTSRAEAALSVPAESAAKKNENPSCPAPPVFIRL